jgi:regulator of protease activity HflC (stomatin/prohibitin superfamily)
LLYIVGMVALTIVLLGALFAAEDGFWRVVGGVGTLLAMAVFTVFCSITIIPAGNAGVATWFGSVQRTVLPEGLTLVNPMTSIETFSTRREIVMFTNDPSKAKDPSYNGPAVLALSSDRNPLTIDISFPYNINADMAWKLYQKVAHSDSSMEKKVLETNARKVVAEVLSRHSWTDATFANRQEIEKELEEEFKVAVTTDLKSHGFTEAEAKQAISVGIPQIREVRPDEKVLNAIAERLASEENLKRQKVLTDIAAQEAERRANEGVGVAKLFAALPKDFRPEQIQAILGALADKERADALTKAVENGRVSVIAIPNNSTMALPMTQVKP